jgi:hypothetical protein
MATSGGQARRRPWVATAMVVALLGLLGHNAWLHSGTSAPHRPHALLSSVGGEFSVSADHAHLSNGSYTHRHNDFATAVLPRPSTSLIQVGATVVAVAITAILAGFIAPAGRGPPNALVWALSGQDILTRFCTARR